MHLTTKQADRELVQAISIAMFNIISFIIYCK